MDPNANLGELLRLVESFNEDRDDPTPLDDTLLDDFRADAWRMAELVEALDGWIRGGGFLPSAWKK